MYFAKMTNAHFYSKIETWQRTKEIGINTFNTRLQKHSGFGVLIDSGYGVNSIIGSVPKCIEIHILSLSKQQSHYMMNKAQ